jgi:hypothetical protein
MRDHVVSFPLALSRSGQCLYSSLHFIKRPSCLSRRLRDSGAPLALINAKYVVSIAQLCCAANLACHRQKENENIVWDVVFLSSTSTRFHHALRDYSFLELEGNSQSTKQESNPRVGNDEEEENEVPVIILMISSSNVSIYMEHLSQFGLGDTQADLEEFLNSQRVASADKFKSWYKITEQELECFSLEDCVLTKVFTKMI